MRLEYPELSLSELAAEFDPPVTKSCLNHRLRKITQLAKRTIQRNVELRFYKRKREQAMDRCEQAVGYHKKGFNCCQSVLAAFQDVIGLTETQCLTLGGGFGAGAGTGELCGAVIGAVMVLDLLTPADPADVIGSKKRSVGQAKELPVRGAFDALRCADLLQKKLSRTMPPPQPRLWGLPPTATT